MTATRQPQPPMLFAFRGIRRFQVFVVAVALLSGVGAVLLAREVVRGTGIILVVPAVVLLFVFGWSFAAALRAPTSFVAITEDRTRIRFLGAVDTVVATSDILSARLVNWRLVGGVGIRPDFAGRVALITASGAAAELQLRHPIRVSVIPGLLRVRANQLTLSVKNPQRLVERCNPRPTQARRQRSKERSS